MTSCCVRDRFYPNNRDTETHLRYARSLYPFFSWCWIFYSFSPEGKCCATLMRRKSNAVRLDGDGISYLAGSSTLFKISGHLLMVFGIRAVISCSKASNIDISGAVSQGQFEEWVSERLCRIGDGVGLSSTVCVILGIYD